MEPFSNPSATDPYSRSTDGDTLESLRDELVRFTYEMQSRLEVLTEQVAQQIAAPVSKTLCDPSASCNTTSNAVDQHTDPAVSSNVAVKVAANVGPRNELPAAKTKTPVESNTSRTPLESASVVVDSKPTARADLLTELGPLERLAAIAQRLEQQLSKEDAR